MAKRTGRTGRRREPRVLAVDILTNVYVQARQFRDGVKGVYVNDEFLLSEGEVIFGTVRPLRDAVDVYAIVCVERDGRTTYFRIPWDAMRFQD